MTIATFELLVEWFAFPAVKARVGAGPHGSSRATSQAITAAHPAGLKQRSARDGSVITSSCTASVPAPPSYDTIAAPSPAASAAASSQGAPSGGGVRTLGLGMVVAGELLRKLAIITGGKAFTHDIQSRRRPGHTLVTRGVYALWRRVGVLRGGASDARAPDCSARGRRACAAARMQAPGLRGVVDLVGWDAGDAAQPGQHAAVRVAGARARTCACAVLGAAGQSPGHPEAG